MNTSALTVSNLAQLILLTVEAARNEDLRATGESDDQILGKLNLLDSICVSCAISTHGDRMTAAEDAVLQHAREQLEDACDHLQAVAATTPKPLAESAPVPV